MASIIGPPDHIWPLTTCCVAMHAFILMYIHFHGIMHVVVACMPISPSCCIH